MFLVHFIPLFNVGWSESLPLDSHLLLAERLAYPDLQGLNTPIYAVIVLEVSRCPIVR